MYYIYRIPLFVHPDGTIGKIGVSENPKTRVKAQKYVDYDILEEHTCIYEVSKREQELQREWGYPVDKKPYWKTVQFATFESRSAGGQKNVESGQVSTAGKKGGPAAAASPNASYKQKRTCPHCGYISSPAAIGTHIKWKHKKGNLLLDSL